MRAAARFCFAASLAALGVACEDLRQFSGTWVGDVSRDPAHQQGFGPGARTRATVGSLTRATIDLTLELPERPGQAYRFEPIRHVADDVLADLRFEGDPLRTYIGWVRPPDVTPLLVFVSLFAEDRIELRLIRGPDEAYGVFYLCRNRPCGPSGGADPGGGAGVPPPRETPPRR